MTKTDSSTLKTDHQRLESQLQALYTAWQVRSGPDMRKLFSDDEERLVLWGTERWERIKGRAEADREFDRWIDTCPPWTSFEVTYREMDVREGIAWVAEEVTRHRERCDPLPYHDGLGGEGRAMEGHTRAHRPSVGLARRNATAGVVCVRVHKHLSNRKSC